MAKQKRNAWDDLKEAGRRILKEIDDLLQPARPPAPQPAPVPVPARQRKPNPGDNRLR